jgi:hypothetical protein
MSCCFIPTTLYFDTNDNISSQRQQRILDKEKREKRRRLTTRQTARRQHRQSPLYPFLTQASGPKSSAVLSSPNQTSSPLSRLVACRTILLQGYNSSLRLRMYALYALSVFARPSGAQLHSSHGALINLCIAQIPRPRFLLSEYLPKSSRSSSAKTGYPHIPSVWHID